MNVYSLEHISASCCSWLNRDGARARRLGGVSERDQILPHVIKRALMTNFYAYAPKFAYIYIKIKN